MRPALVAPHFPAPQSGRDCLLPMRHLGQVDETLKRADPASDSRRLVVASLSFATAEAKHLSPPRCLLCDGPTAPASRMGWLQAPDRQAIFVTCGACSDCPDSELEHRIADRVSRPADAPAGDAAEAWARAAAREWTAAPATA